MSLLVAVTDSICYRLLLAGHLTRGAVVRGKLHHDSSHILGPALVKAHKIESKIAKYPRIVVDDSARPLLAQLFADEGRLIRADSDGLYVLDCLSHFDRPERELEEARERIRIWAQRRAEQYAGDERRYPKYEWLLNFLKVDRRRPSVETGHGQGT